MSFVKAPIDPFLCHEQRNIHLKQPRLIVLRILPEIGFFVSIVKIEFVAEHMFKLMRRTYITLW